MNTEQPTSPAVVLSTALLERIDDLAKWFTDNPNHSDIKDGLTVLVRDVAFAEREACASLCAEVVTYPPGHGGQYEGYGPVKTTRSGNECAEAIRLRSNAGGKPLEKSD